MTKIRSYLWILGLLGTPGSNGFSCWFTFAVGNKKHYVSYLDIEFEAKRCPTWMRKIENLLFINLWWKARNSMEAPDTHEQWDRVRWVSLVRQTETWNCTDKWVRSEGKLTDWGKWVFITDQRVRSQISKRVCVLPWAAECLWVRCSRRYPAAPKEDFAPQPEHKTCQYTCLHWAVLRKAMLTGCKSSSVSQVQNGKPTTLRFTESLESI